MANPWDKDTVIQAAPAKKSAWDKKAPLKSLTPQQRRDSVAALRKSDAIMNEGLKKLTPPQRKKALANYYASPVVQRLRQEAGMPALRTRDEELQTIARQSARKQDRITKGGIYDIPYVGKALKGFNDVTEASQAGFSKALFGLPERLAAGADYVLGNNEGTKNYSEDLAVRRKVGQISRDKSTTGNVLGQIVGFGSGGQAATGVVRAGGQLVGKIAPGAGNFIQNLTRLTAGRIGTRAAGIAPGASTVVSGGTRAANAAKIVTGGSAAGAAQAAGEGSDVKTGAITGAIAAPLVLAGFKGTEWATRPIRDFLRMSSAKSILGRHVSTTAEELQDLAAAFRTRTGREPTVYEVLPAADRDAVLSMVKKMPAASRERVTENVRTRVAAMPDELAGRTAELTAPQQRYMAQQLAREMAASRGASARPTADEIALAQRAVRDPTEMEAVRGTISRNIMAPHDNAIAYGSVDDLIPTHPVNNNGTISQEISDQQIASTIRGAAGTLRLSPDGVRVQDVTQIISRLRGVADRGGVEGDAAQKAINHLEDIMARDHPQVADAIARMTEAYSANSRMLEAIPEGRETRLRENVPADNGDAARGVRQAYDTPEGAAGRAVGQRAELLTDFAGTPTQAISRAAQIADSPGTQEAIRRNLGGGVGEDISQAASAQAESLRRLGALRQPVKGDEGDMDFGDLAMSMSLLSPTSLIRTKSQAVGTLLRLINGIPEARANQIVEALFSRNPRAMAQAARLLTSAGDNASRALRDIVATIAVGAQAGSAVSGIDGERGGALESEMQSDPIGDPAPAEGGDVPWEQDEQLDAGDVPYGRAVVEALFPGVVHVTDDIRDPNSELGQENPNSYHVTTDGAVDVRPIPGMSFDQFVQTIRDAGYEIIEAIDEVNNPSAHATGPHWHVVFA